MDEQILLQIIEACECMNEFIPEDTCVGCPFFLMEKVKCLFDDKYKALEDYCIRTINKEILRGIDEIREKQKKRINTKSQFRKQKRL